MARSFRRNFWLWFLVTLPLPVIGNYILLCLGDNSEIKFNKEEKNTNQPKVKRNRQFTHEAIPVAARA